MPCYIRVRAKARRLNMQGQLPPVPPTDKEIQLALNAIDHEDVQRILDLMSAEDFQKFLLRLRKLKAPEEKIEVAIYA